MNFSGQEKGEIKSRILDFLNEIRVCSPDWGRIKGLEQDRKKLSKSPHCEYALILKQASGSKSSGYVQNVSHL